MLGALLSLFTAPAFSFRETCSLSKKRKTKREMMSERRIQEEYAKLGPIRCVALLPQRPPPAPVPGPRPAPKASPPRPSYPEVVTGLFFILMTLLWFTREPGFVPGWTSLFEK